MTIMSMQIHPSAKIVLCLYLLVSGAGCAFHKENWQEWMEWNGERQAITAEAEAKEASWSEPHVDPLMLAEGYEIGDAARVGERFNLDMRNPGFPETHIDSIFIDLTDPQHEIRIVWAGPDANQGPVGPWRSNPGRGKVGFDCNDFDESNTPDSYCTPKGLFPVAGFTDQLGTVPSCHYVTWIQHAPRFIGLHSHGSIPTWPNSHGCVRIPYDVAQLIHNNSLVGTTMISIDGTWTRPQMDDEATY